MADWFYDLTREYLRDPRGVPTLYDGSSAERAALRWRDVPVAFGRRADGRVTAAVLGVTGVGPTEADALRDLERRLRAE